MKQIPYGISDYERITLQDYYYIDKTHYIPLIEQAASYFFLIRPRRFGKSLMLNMLAAYYDINNEGRFEELFGERWIYRNPTKWRAKFMILRFNFSAVDNDPEKMRQSFDDHCNERFNFFCNDYEHLFRPGFREELDKLDAITTKLQRINSEASFLKLRIYVIIDEYDNFTNSILANFGENAYNKATHGESFFRYFFNILKELTTSNGAAVERMFITGVSPITMDDVTSGFNIGTNFTLDSRFNGVVGFSEAELREMLEYYRQQGALKMSVDEMIREMKPWYDNYCFSTRCLDQSMYNSDMTLYYASHCLGHGTPPEELIDKNIRTDYNKLRHLIKVDKEASLTSNFSIIREIVEEGYTTAKISDGFPMEEMKNPNNFKSMLYYFGLVSIQGSRLGQAILAIPNHTVREQMYNYLVDGLWDLGVFRVDFYQLAELMENMAIRGAWQPVFNYIAGELKSQSRVRDFIDGERHVKAFMLAYLGLTNFYLVLPEYELNKGYADIFFQPAARITGIEYAYLLEVKYMKQTDPDSKIEALKADAREQLLRYANDEALIPQLNGAKLKMITVVFKGWEIIETQEVAAMEETKKTDIPR